jgi:hypothetical protein
MKLTERRLHALRLVADGQVEYATSYGNWEPKVGYRLAAFDWLEENGLIRAVVEAEPVGRVMKLVPVVLTDAGAAVLGDQEQSSDG